MAHARGVVMLTCRQAGVAVMSLAATQIKKSLTGNGHASKLQMQRAIQSTCGEPAQPVKSPRNPLGHTPGDYRLLR